MGENLYPARHSNLKGFFEDPEINKINEDIITSAGVDIGSPGQGWLSQVSLDVRYPEDEKISHRILRLIENMPFCFKDPRFAYTLPVWNSFLEDTAFLCIFRDPAVTVGSMLRECQHMPYLQGLEMNCERAFKVWSLVYRHIIDFHRHHNEWVFLHYDQLFQKKNLDKLEEITGTPVDRSFPDRKLNRAMPQCEVPKDIRALYSKLCEFAGFSESNTRKSEKVGEVPHTASSGKDETVLLEAGWGYLNKIYAEGKADDLLKNEHVLDLDSSVQFAEGKVLYDLVRLYQPLKTVETGFGNGLSTLFVLLGLLANGRGKHICIDPFQQSQWKGIGSAVIQNSGLSTLNEHMDSPSYIALPELLARKVQIEFAFIDGSQLFDDVFIDWYYIDKMLNMNGVIVFHDYSSSPAVRTAVDFVKKNLGYSQINIPKAGNICALKKVDEVYRPWHHFKPFGLSDTKSVGAGRSS